MKKTMVILLVVLMVSCMPKKQSEPITGDVELLNTDSLSISESEEIKPERPVYRAAETILTDLIHTRLEVSFDWKLSRMKGLAQLTAKPHFYPSDSLILDAKGMDILKVQLDGKDLTYTYDSSYLKIKLGRTFTRSDKYTVNISYVAKPDERVTGGSSAITSDKGLYFINPKGEEKSKMPQIWTQGETEASSVWFPTIDAPNVKTTQEIFITVEDKYVTLSNGKLVKLLGVEYPWDKYHQIVVREYVSGAMENTGAVIFGDFVYKNDRELLDGNDQSTIAHELFHHWFGDLVTCESWSNLPLNESFANYSQYLWDEYRFGLDEADYQAEGEADGYFQSAQGGGYHNLIWFDYEDKEQMFDGHSYNKGGRILHMLRCYLGDEAFFKGINLYLTANKFKPAEFHQLRLAFEDVSGEDLNWFFNQWFLGSAHPVLDVSQKFDAAAASVTVSVKQNQSLEISPIFRLPVDVAVFDSEGKHVHRIFIDQLEQSFVLPVKGELKCVLFDDQQMLLAKIREDKPVDQYIFQYYNGKRYKARKNALNYGTKGKDPRIQQLILDGLKDPFWSIRLSAIEKASKLNEENKVKALSMIRSLATDDANSQVRSSALNYLGSNADEAMVKEIAKDRIEKDRSYSVISTALKQLGKLDADFAMEKAAALEAERSSKMISGIAQLYGSFGKEEKLKFFENTLKGGILQGFDELGVLNSLTYFVSRQEPEVLDKAYELYDYLSENGAFYTQMFLPQNAGYLVSAFGDKIDELNLQVEEFEKSKDAALADQCRKKIKKYEVLKEKYAPLASSPEE